MLIAFRINWFDLLAVQRTLKSLLQHPNWKALIFRHAAFFMVQLSHLYMTNRKTVALSIQKCVSKGMPLLFNRLSRFVRVFLPRSILISWLLSLSAVNLQPRKIISVSTSTFSLSIFPITLFSRGATPFKISTNDVLRIPVSPYPFHCLLSCVLFHYGCPNGVKCCHTWC